MTMMFEVMDLAQASPATVSRCGMVYMDPSQLGWKPMVLSWMERTCGRLPLDAKLQLLQLFDYTVPVSIAFVRRELKHVLPYVDTSLVVQLLRNFTTLGEKSSRVALTVRWDMCHLTPCPLVPAQPLQPTSS